MASTLLLTRVPVPADHALRVRALVDGVHDAAQLRTALAALGAPGGECHDFFSGRDLRGLTAALEQPSSPFVQSRFYSE
jgi:hypothetical protein